MARAQLTITLNDDSTISVTGPIGERLLCYGLLETARDVIQSHAVKQEQQLIIPVAPTLSPPALNTRN